MNQNNNSEAQQETHNKNDKKKITRFNHFLSNVTKSWPENLKTEKLENHEENNKFVENSKTTSVLFNYNNNNENILNKTVEDVTNDDNVIYPLPVPFLTRPPKLHTAQHIADNIIITQTLPPSIVIAPLHSLNTVISAESETYVSNQNFTTSYSSISSELAKLEEFKLQTNEFEKNNILSDTINKKTSSLNLNADDIQEKKSSQKNLPTAIIIVCLSTVALVMCAVFVGMCAAKRRQIQLIGSNSEPSVILNSNAIGLSKHNTITTNRRLAHMNGMYGHETLNRYHKIHHKNIIIKV